MLLAAAAAVIEICINTSAAIVVITLSAEPITARPPEYTGSALQTDSMAAIVAGPSTQAPPKMTRTDIATSITGRVGIMSPRPVATISASAMMMPMMLSTAGGSPSLRRKIKRYTTTKRASTAIPIHCWVIVEPILLNTLNSLSQRWVRITMQKPPATRSKSTIIPAGSWVWALPPLRARAHWLAKSPAAHARQVQAITSGNWLIIRMTLRPSNHGHAKCNRMRGGYPCREPDEYLPR